MLNDPEHGRKAEGEASHVSFSPSEMLAQKVHRRRARVSVRAWLARSRILLDLTVASTAPWLPHSPEWLPSRAKPSPRSVDHEITIEIQ